MTTKPPLGLTPRNFWLRDRVVNIIAALQRLEISEDWEQYRSRGLEFAKELNYALTEWDKYYD